MIKILLFLKVYLNVLFYVSGQVKDDSKRASSYLPLPKELKGKQWCLSIQNNDKKCFLWSILESLHPIQCRNNPLIVSKYQKYEHELNMFGIQYHIDIKDISKFEHQNNISVNAYGYKNKKIFPLRITSVTVARHHLNFFCITAGEKSH